MESLRIYSVEVDRLRKILDVDEEAMIPRTFKQH